MEMEMEMGMGMGMGMKMANPCLRQVEWQAFPKHVMMGLETSC